MLVADHLRPAVHNPIGVCGVQRIDNLGSQLQQLFNGERLSADLVLERLPSFSTMR
jgi:hypothetical protein